MKTRLEWMKSISDPIVRDNALLNLEINNGNDFQIVSSQPCSSFQDALLGAFVWDDTHEGHVFWASVYKSYEES